MNLVDFTSNTPDHRTCFCYDDVMLKHSNIFEEHPERPERILQSIERFQQLNLDKRCKKVKPRTATDEELLTVHSNEYIDEISKIDCYPQEKLKLAAEQYDSIYFSNFTNECARMSVGCTLAALDYILSGNAQNGVVIARPPGHHAERDFSMGYCYFNNVAIAAKVAQEKWNIKRVLIVDWDIHHGNGTQHMFQSDSSVLYFSIHRFDHGRFWPGKKYSDFDFVGKNEGEGFNINVAWNEKHMNDADYIAVFQRILLPVAYEFCPELVIVSAGFDAAQGDPKGLCDVTPEGFAHLTHMLMSLAFGKILLVLEGGYNLSSVAESLCSCVKTLLGDPCPLLEPMNISHCALESIQSTLNAHSQYWKNLQQIKDDAC
ncbi:histone deacetylase 6-like [Xenia sp. Carnegie-2017]|uniref:histone deacetylase 6-like n=1 Tax=Xenia sp. Carnegie-2017 TaxID=2897299 RepID=UPI001F035347|nr:histone deacetylase 6-like [Xenia sp. Carnegie-2017]